MSYFFLNLAPLCCVRGSAYMARSTGRGMRLRGDLCSVELLQWDERPNVSGGLLPGRQRARRHSRNERDLNLESATIPSPEVDLYGNIQWSYSLLYIL